MKAPNLESFSVSRPLAQVGHCRGSPPSARGGNRCGAKQRVERVDDFGDLQVLDLADRADEVAPEVAQHVAPGDLVVRDQIELFLERGGEIVLDVFGEEAFQERDDDAAAVLRIEPALVEPHILAVLEHLQDRGIGRRPADAEFFHALDEGGFRIARRRLGKMLGRGDRALGEVFAGAHCGQAAGLLVVEILVAAFLVEREEAVEFHHGARRAQVQQLLPSPLAGGRVVAAISTVVRSSSANSIWLAMVRSQINS